ncbi:DoxX family protein [Azotobacter chroococcum]|uniref:DoxX family protein n=1 Tax=Azotobacter chroococcum NCIMB 8003 TaxID=1328314 RepID=A0A0C4WUM6_9GAMM|nr:DoxX family protein [Azotobacter chroococcum]AJE23615.1 DoxX family protein [Azotobacter chroococcum NCIMB 8003]
MNDSSPARLIAAAVDLCRRIPYGLIAFLARFSIAAVFWKSGQTKVEGLAIDLVSGTFELGLPRLTPSTVPLFAEEYRVPLLPPELAAHAAAFAEHVFPVLLLAGLATRLSALALLGMTLVIQVFVYPDAYPTHGTWAACLLLLIARGPGALSLDRLIAGRYGYNRRPGT